MSSDILPAKLQAYIEKSGVALSLSTQDGDVPLALVNSGFTKLTGYEPDEVEGRNCRFLQGEETSAEQVQALHDFVHDPSQDSGRFPVMNYRKDGSLFRNLVLMSRLRNSAGDTRLILASQFDMTNADQRRQLVAHDARLRRNLSDIEAMGQEFGLAMQGSAQAIADSIALMARLSLDE
ncbi:PAS domain-containing protein [Sagittula sp. P11]|jgi:PAS domain S-box-containing protein|uniref:PAS domain-containing protein n=1 Tax=Sagittula sp. P11 TaxID=2009329 RepID=UPI0018E25CA5|nr:PAS domain-containing protein [Sagittula sp. P11]